MRINVTKSFLPDKQEYINQIEKIWNNAWLTNNGPLLVELEEKLRLKINNPNLLVVTNGTIAIQIALKALNIKGEVITTPYSYCATTTAILWENSTPVFVDINEHDFNINADLIEAKITDKTEAILATHVYGLPCEVEKIEKIAVKHNLKVIYDAAHAFGCQLNGSSLLSYGDISTCSFHATKVFHTVEGGCVVSKSNEIQNQLKLLRSFGHVNDDYFTIGINAKNSEFHAAMGLTNLPHFEEIVDGRKRVCNLYDKSLNFNKIRKPATKEINFTWNCSYYPVVFENTKQLEATKSKLEENQIFTRRYFYPSLNTLDYLDHNLKVTCPTSEDISKRVLCLPLYPDLEIENQERIISIVNQSLKQ